jgi:hypothetical protein
MLWHSEQFISVTMIAHVAEERCFLCGPCRGYITRTSCNESLEAADRRVGVWCEMTPSLRGRELGNGINQLLKNVKKFCSKGRVSEHQYLIVICEV